MFIFQTVIDANIFPVLIDILGKAEFKTRKEAAWAITNATSGGSPEQIQFLVNLVLDYKKSIFLFHVLFLLIFMLYIIGLYPTAVRVVDCDGFQNRSSGSQRVGEHSPPRAAGSLQVPCWTQPLRHLNRRMLWFVPCQLSFICT